MTQDTRNLYLALFTKQHVCIHYSLTFITMASQAVQAKANALNAKMETEAGSVLDSIERTMVRKVARHSFKCAVDCYDKAGTTGGAETLDGCARNCQVPYQQTQQLVQNEVSQFQNRLNSNMNECQQKARDHMTPGIEDEPKKMAKVETILIDCMAKTVDEHIKLLKPLQNRVSDALKNIK